MLKPIDMKRNTINNHYAEIERSFNRLTLNHRGLDSFPGQIVLIDSFAVENMEDGCEAILRGAHINGYIDPDHSGGACRSFFVGLGHDYWHRDSLEECLYLIECLRFLNGYTGPSLKDYFTNNTSL
jgi:hypothetical protein